jgi:transcriptional regulator with XRE-family HTH domain
LISCTDRELGALRVLLAEQIRAARALLGLSQTELAEHAQIGSATVKRIEAAKGRITGTAETLWRIQIALEKAGVVLMSESDGKGPGVRLSKPIGNYPSARGPQRSRSGSGERRRKR